MKRLILPLLLALLAALPAPAHCAERFAFVRWNGGTPVIFRADAKGASKTAARGCDPEISPDGSRLAFTEYASDGGRRIALYDLAEKKTTVLRHIPGANSYGPRWSPDGGRLLFNIFRGGSWQIGRCDLKTKAVAYVKSPAGDLFSPFWSEDGNSFFAQDMTKLCRFSAADGKMIEAIPLSSVKWNGMELVTSSAVRFEALPNGRLLFCAELAGEKCPACASFGEGEGLKSAAFIFDMKSKKTERLTPKEFCVLQAWRFGDAVAFSAHKTSARVTKAKKTIDFSFYIIDAEGKAPRTLY